MLIDVPFPVHAPAGGGPGLRKSDAHFDRVRRTRGWQVPHARRETIPFNFGVRTGFIQRHASRGSPPAALITRCSNGRPNGLLVSPSEHIVIGDTVAFDANNLLAPRQEHLARGELRSATGPRLDKLYAMSSAGASRDTPISVPTPKPSIGAPIPTSARFRLR